MIRTAPVDLLAAMQRLRQQYAQGLAFAPEQERQFVAQCGSERLGHFIRTGLAGMVLFNIFLVSDWYMVPDVFDFAWRLRLFVLTPYVLCFVTLASVARGWWERRVPYWVNEVLCMVGTMLVSLCLGILLMATSSDQASVYRAGLIPVLVFGNLVQRPRFRYSLVSTLFTILVFGLSWWVSQVRGPQTYGVIDGPMAMLVLVVAFYTLLSNYNLELDERQRFVQTERAQALSRELALAHQRLDQQSRLDALTGLPNRRHFDDFMRTALSGSREAGTGVALLIVDVDHFKAFNDRYGHPAGDQCLRLLAQALHRACGGEQALLARWGGEEFALVLSHSSVAKAQHAAEHMRQVVQDLAMRHEASEVARHVTITVGVAFVPGPMLAEAGGEAALAARLVAQADEALYQGKLAGRNRCVVAACQVG